MSRINPPLFLWILLSLVPFVSVANVQADGIYFVENAASWQAIVDQSEVEDKPIFVDVYTEWCGPCKWMDQHVFSQKEVGEYMNREFINVKVDAEKDWGVAFARNFGVGAYPTYLFFAPDGDLVYSSKGSQPADVFLKGVEYALGNWKDGISIRGLETLLTQNANDFDLFKEYMTRLAGSSPATSLLLDRYLQILPEDSLMTASTVRLIKSNLPEVVSFQSRGFEIVLMDYQRKPVRNLFVGSSWNTLRNKFIYALEDAATTGNGRVLEQIVLLQDVIYPPEIAPIYQKYYKAYYAAYTEDVEQFVPALEDFIKTIYRPDEVESILRFDRDEYEQSVRLETEAVRPEQLSEWMQESLIKSHMGIVRLSIENTYSLISLFKRVFPDSFQAYDKQKLDRALHFTLETYRSNRVFVNSAYINSRQKFINEYKEF